MHIILKSIHPKAGQKRLGLGEAQRVIIDYYARLDRAELVRKFLETESGKDIENRPFLKEEIEFCSLHARL